MQLANLRLAYQCVVRYTGGDAHEEILFDFSLKVSRANVEGGEVVIRSSCDYQDKSNSEQFNKL